MTDRACMDHAFYEELCALDSTGQLSAAEQVLLRDHCRGCPGCRAHHAELAVLAAALHLDAALRSDAADMPAGSLDRFRARLVEGGLAPRAVAERAVAERAVAKRAAAGQAAQGQRPPAVAVALASMVFAVLAGLMRLQLASAPPGTPSGGAPPAASASGPLTAAPVPSPPVLASRPAAVVHKARRRPRPLRLLASVPGEPSPQPAPGRMPRYPFFGSHGLERSLPAAYPALSPLQISRLDLFPRPNRPAGRSFTALPEPGGRVDIATANGSFDFAPYVRELRFRIPSSQ